MGALFQSRGWLPIVEAPGYSRHPTSILAMQLLNAFKCNLKELTTKSALSAWGQRSLACACPVAGYIDHVIHWRVQFSFVLGSFNHFLLSPPPLPNLCCFFSTDVFGVAIFQSRGWLPIVEAPGYSRHPACILAMQLLIAEKVSSFNIYLLAQWARVQESYLVTKSLTKAVFTSKFKHVLKLFI